MQDSLKRLWNGTIMPCADKGEKIDEIDITLLCIERSYKHIRELLDDNGKTELEQLEAYYNKLIDMQREYAFKQGFSLATSLITESL